MKKLTGLLFSMELTGMLILLFTVSIGFATFIENDFGTLTAKANVYNARWFEFMLLLLAVNMTGSIVKHKMYLRAKWPVFIFHVSFLIILLGAAVTRYIGYEGSMAIREGNSSSEIVSGDTYIRIWAEEGQDQVYTEKKVFALPGKVLGLDRSLDLNGRSVEVEVVDYFKNATEKYVEEEGGFEVLLIVYADDRAGRQDIYLKKGDVKRLGNYSIAFENDFEGKGISIFLKGEELYLVSKDSIQHMDMMANESVAVPPDSIYPLKAMNLYNTGTANIVLKQFMRSAVTKLVSNESLADGMALDAFTAKVSVDGKSGEVNVFGGYGYLARSSEVEIDGVKVSISYGSKVIDLPFRIQVEDFILDRYPGSNSPASYASEVTVIDEERSLVMPYKIYMNNVLNYRGYRFFQSSYDKDEKGTVFSVNHDAPGTIITYIGYLLMTIGMIVTLFYRNSRFSRLLKKAGEVRQSRKTLAMLLLIAGLTGGLSMQAMARGAIDNIPVIDKAHAEAFGTLQVLGSDGRQEPVSTLTSEILRKIARKTSFEGLSPDQVYLGIMAYPQLWNDVPIIKITHPQLKDFLGVEGKYAAFSQIVDLATGEYKIREFVDNAYAKKPSMQSKFDKDVIQVDERVNIYYMVYTGSFLKIFPVKGDNNNSWVASGNSKDMFDEANGIPVRSAFANYIMAIVGAAESGDWSVANEHLEAIRDYQREYGSAIYLSDAKVSMEIFYNKFNIFKRLSMYYGLIGFILLVLHFINILRPKINLRAVIKIGSVLIFLLFLLHTAGLTIRWYISGHAPWSDGYESMIYIAWATALSGLIFVWRSEITLSVTALMASLILAVAGMSWMDPEITNLVPVLKSYWLIIHVAIITASYGFLGLGALLGFLNLVLMIVKSKKSLERVNLTIKELTHINEMTLIIGLFLLTIGTFLGGVWANESWGRYWGWDPKETWALATVGFYSFVVHFRLIPGLKGKFAFNFAALISYGFVLMTYFGVNYYLSGLHSYASGDPVPVPSFVYYTLAVIAGVSIWAYLNDRKYAEKKLK